MSITSNRPGGVSGFVTTTGSENISNKSFSGNMRYSTTNIGVAANTFAKGSSIIYRVNSGTGPLNTISGGNDGNFIIVENKSGVDLVVANNAAAGGFLTGTGSDIVLSDDSCLHLIYNSTDARWQVVGGTGSGGFSATYQNSAYSVQSGDDVLADTSVGAFTITMPAAPLDGDKFRIVDVEGTFGTNNVTIARNGNTIQGVADDLLLDLDNLWIEFVYSLTADDWRIVGPNQSETYVLASSSQNGLVSIVSQQFSGAKEFLGAIKPTGGFDTTGNVGLADASNPGLMGTGPQIIAGAKEFTGDITVANLSGSGLDSVISSITGTGGVSSAAPLNSFITLTNTGLFRVSLFSVGGALIGQPAEFIVGFRSTGVIVFIATVYSSSFGLTNTGADLNITSLSASASTIVWSITRVV